MNLAAEQPEVLNRLQAGVTRLWQESCGPALAPVHIHLGDPREPTVTLTSVDWRPLQAGKQETEIQKFAHWMNQAISQEMLDWQNAGRAPKLLAANKMRLNGYWNVCFTRPGLYEFRASVAPPEVRDQVRLKGGTVWLKVDGQTVAEALIEAGSHEAVVRWKVEKPFRGELQVVWSGQLPFEAELGAFVCEVKTVQDTHELRNQRSQTNASGRFDNGQDIRN